MKRDWDSYWAFASDAHEPTVMTHALLSIFSSPKRIMTFLANRLAASWRAWLPALTVSLCLFACRLGRAETFHVSPKGTDAASGSQQDPFRTVQQAADVAQPGDVVLVRPGTYRERVSPPRGGSAGKPIVFRSVVRHGAIIKGSDLISGPWKEEADDIWSAAVSPELFTDTAHVDGGNVFEIPLSSTPWGREGRPEYLRSLENERGGNPDADPNLVFTLGQVFVNGHPLRQAGSSSELAAATDTWWYERATRRLHVHLPPPLSPAEETVEITTRRRIFAPHKRGLGHIHLEGFVFEHCGNQYPTDFWMKEKPQQQQAGAVGTRSGHHWVIRHNIIRLAKSIGLDLGLEGHPDTDLETGRQKRPGSNGFHVVEDNWILDNGAAGTASYFGSHLSLRRNVIVGNNRLRFIGDKRWESGGLKLHRPKRSVIEGNYIAFNDHWGIWLDQGSGLDTRINGNLIVGHGVGLDFEAATDDAAVAVNNVLINNRVGISFREAGGVLVAHNLIAGADTGIDMPVGGNRPGNWTRDNVFLVGNIIDAKNTIVKIVDKDSSGRGFTGNLYVSAEGRPKWQVYGKPDMPFPTWQAYWSDRLPHEASDTTSQLMPAMEISFDPWAAELQLTLPDSISPPLVTIQDGMEADYLGQAAASNRPAGPLLRLPAGESRHLLWPHPLPWRP